MDFWYLPDDQSLLAAAHRAGANLLYLLGEPITFSIHPEDADPFMERLGWDLLETVEAQELEARYVKDDRHIYPAAFLVRARTT